MDPSGDDLRVRAALAAIIALYLALGAAYALRTPLWQAPDEPAHFNYIKNIADGNGLPVLKEGDYDGLYLEELKANRFPSDKSVASLRYESHQPPLYYLLASPILWAAKNAPLSGQVMSVRLFSLLWGAVALVLAFRIVREVFPHNILLTLSVPAFIAFIPQRLAINAAVTNDPLAEAVFSVLLLWLVIELRVGLFKRNPARSILGLGVLLGIALLTKVTAYGGVLLVALGLFVTWWGKKEDLGAVLPRLFLVYLIALVISGPWFLRNLMIYGDFDFTGLGRHALVVVGQPAPSGWSLEVARHFAVVTFRSFWLQLGWMGVPADPRVYTILAGATALGGVGFILMMIRAVRRKDVFTMDQALSLTILTVGLLIIAFEMGLYNLQFIQPQGRYLFPAVVPIALFFLLGLQEVIGPRYLPLAYGCLLGGMFILNLYALIGLVPLLRPA